MKDGGFTLLEVMIALVILAVALAAATRASQMATDSTFTVKQRLIAGWVAENRLAERHASSLKPWPEPGTTDGEATQAGLTFSWQEIISDTPNKAFRRIEVRVYSPRDKDYALATLVGYIANTRS